PACLPMTLRISALTGSLWVPSPRAMNELWNGWPSMVPRTLTRPLVPKNCTDSGQTRYVQPPLASLCTRVAVNSLFICASMQVGPRSAAELIGAKSGSRLAGQAGGPGVEVALMRQVHGPLGSGPVG